MHLYNGLPWWLSSKESSCNAGATEDGSSIPGLGRSPAGGHGNPPQYSCLENSSYRKPGGLQSIGRMVSLTKIVWAIWQTLSLCVHANLLQSCPTLSDLMDYTLPGSSVHGVLQARIRKWVAISFSRGSSWLRDWTHDSCVAGGSFTTEPPGKPPSLYMIYYYMLQCTGAHGRKALTSHMVKRSI